MTATEILPLELASFWLVILAAGAACWFASAIIHMVIKYHNSDYSELSNEDQVMDAIRAGNPSPALYTTPHCSDMKMMEEESMQAKFNNGPVAMITILPNGMPPMGKLLGQQLAFFIVGSALIAYLVTMALSGGSSNMEIIRFVFVAAFLTYGWAEIPYSIWMGQPWSNCVKYIIDAVIYAAATAGVFVALWPA